jgi:hypothetical protein
VYLRAEVRDPGVTRHGLHDLGSASSLTVAGGSALSIGGKQPVRVPLATLEAYRTSPSWPPP